MGRIKEESPEDGRTGGGGEGRNSIKDKLQGANGICGGGGERGGISAADWAASQVADGSRLPWAWHTSKRWVPLYTPVMEREWWSLREEGLARMRAQARRNASHIGCNMG